MIELKLSADESRVLREVLESYLSDLRMEIANTNSFDFRSMLKAEEEVLNKLLGQLPKVPEEGQAFQAVTPQQDD